jgi:NADPH:quinone reductase-like Zn-dependent oxidoreductase
MVQRSWRVLHRGGVMVSVAKSIPENEPREHGVRGLFFIVVPDRDQLEEMARLIDAGSLKPIVASILPLARARDAFELGAKGHTRGKIILQVRDDTPRA